MFDVASFNGNTASPLSLIIGVYSNQGCDASKLMMGFAAEINKCSPISGPDNAVLITGGHNNITLHFYGDSNCQSPSSLNQSITIGNTSSLSCGSFLCDSCGYGPSTNSFKYLVGADAAAILGVSPGSYSTVSASASKSTSTTGSGYYVTNAMVTTTTTTKTTSATSTPTSVKYNLQVERYFSLAVCPGGSSAAASGANILFTIEGKSSTGLQCSLNSYRCSYGTTFYNADAYCAGDADMFDVANFNGNTASSLSLVVGLYSDLGCDPSMLIMGFAVEINKCSAITGPGGSMMITGGSQIMTITFFSDKMCQAQSVSNTIPFGLIPPMVCGSLYMSDGRGGQIPFSFKYLAGVDAAAILSGNSSTTTIRYKPTTTSTTTTPTTPAYKPLTTTTITTTPAYKPITTTTTTTSATSAYKSPTTTSVKHTTTTTAKKTTTTHHKKITTTTKKRNYTTKK